MKRILIIANILKQLFVIKSPARKKAAKWKELLEESEIIANGGLAGSSPGTSSGGPGPRPGGC